MMKHKSIPPEAVETQIILKDEFMSQSTPDIKKKLHKKAVATDSLLDTWVKTAFSEFFNGHWEEAKEQKQKDQKETAAFVKKKRP